MNDQDQTQAFASDLEKLIDRYVQDKFLYPFRFMNEDNAREYMSNPRAIPGSDHSKRLIQLTVPPYLEFNGRIKPNPDYRDAPIELRVYRDIKTDMGYLMAVYRDAEQ